MRFRLNKFVCSFVSLSEWTRIFLIGLSFFIAMPVYAEKNLPAQSILIFGDSLSAAYGIPQGDGWVALLQKRLTDEGYQYSITNASVSGETTIGGANRLEAQLARVKPNIVIIELGANDGLRGLPIADMQKNLSTMIQASQASGAKVILLGMKIPPNYGPNYTAMFAQVYSALSGDFNTKLVPFMLEKVAANPALIQDDGLHPNAKAQPLLLDHIWPALKPLLHK